MLCVLWTRYLPIGHKTYSASLGLTCVCGVQTQCLKERIKRGSRGWMCVKCPSSVVNIIRSISESVPSPLSPHTVTKMGPHWQRSTGSLPCCWSSESNKNVVPRVTVVMKCVTSFSLSKSKAAFLNWATPSILGLAGFICKSFSLMGKPHLLSSVSTPRPSRAEDGFSGSFLCCCSSPGRL